ncbi:hypothetical protein SAMN04487949_0066 [Halogranum gelatinilyticum]|uniref:Uncharacterized protein n=1 Tax=Halogranum gelatinilyticum TaxID=660521 RepID=A0A1G9NQ82_9EURY|nr:hypothetical protein SAMN04487949_0066 [Halogranum gelatinilyticum]
MVAVTREFETAATRFGASLALGVAAVATVALVAGTGSLLRGLVGVAGAVLVGRSANLLDGESNQRRAIGSVGVVVGSALLVGAVVVADTASGLVALAGLAVMATALDATGGLDEDTGRELFRAILDSGVVLAGFVALAAAVATGLVAAVAQGVLFAGETLLAQNSFVLLLSVQLGVLLVVLLLARALPRYDEWLPDAWLPEQRAVLDQLATELWEVPRWVWLALGGQVVLVGTDWAPPLVERLLGLLSVFGEAIRFLLRSGVLHIPLALLVTLLAGTVLADYVRHAVVVWAGDEPPETLANAGGGLVVGAVVGLLTAIPPLVALVVSGFHPESSAATLSAAFGLGATTLGTVVAALVAVLTTVGTALWLSETSYVPATAGGFAIGSGLLFVAALAGTVSGVPAFLTFVGVAAALLVWDLGENAVGLGHQLGVEAETRRGEVVHATGSLLAVGVGVVVALVAMYGLGPLSVPSGGRAALALALALVSLVAFVVAIERGDGNDGEDSRRGADGVAEGQE